jgi:hypothetical protein
MLISGLFAQLLASGHHTVRIPMSPAAARAASRANRISGMILIVTLGLSLLTPVGPLAFPPVITALGLRWAWLHRTSVQIRARRGEIWLMGLHPDFIQAGRGLRFRPAEVIG